jgi:hypothetical protein
MLAAWKVLGALPAFEPCGAWRATFVPGPASAGVAGRPRGTVELTEDYAALEFEPPAAPCCPPAQVQLNARLPRLVKSVPGAPGARARLRAEVPLAAGLSAPWVDAMRAALEHAIAQVPGPCDSSQDEVEPLAAQGDGIAARDAGGPVDRDPTIEADVEDWLAAAGWSVTHRPDGALVVDLGRGSHPVLATIRAGDHGVWFRSALPPVDVSCDISLWAVSLLLASVGAEVRCVRGALTGGRRLSIPVLEAALPPPTLTEALDVVCGALAVARLRYAASVAAVATESVARWYVGIRGDSPVRVKTHACLCARNHSEKEDIS